MFIDDIISRFFTTEKEHLIVTDADGELVWKSEFFPYSLDDILDDIKSGHDEGDEWEFLDTELRVNLKVRRMAIEYEGKKYVCCHYTDVTEYSMLMKEALAYTKNIAEISSFQAKIMRLMSGGYDAFLPVLANYCSAKELVMYADTDGYITKSVYDGTLSRTRLENSTETDFLFSCRRDEKRGGYHCLLSSETEGRRYCVFARVTPSLKLDNFLDISAYNVLSLFIENSILREKIVYESEHDRLTGLYNKGKYMAMKADNFGSPASIAIYNFDVNNLKYINDNFGHERGDELIIKAANSIHAVVSDKVFGFRMGGDEYVMVAVNVSEDEAKEVRTKWEDALVKLNEDGDVYCVMACGLQYGEGAFDYDGLYHKADEQMYLDKKARKEKGQTSHLK
ncbi:MAG: GGDEF domain-containing protein [Ruminiclostridium sp.]|nr:GGDEF domain-containing protein [Ruminiclostridium sp.]